MFTSLSLHAISFHHPWPQARNHAEVPTHALSSLSESSCVIVAESGTISPQPKAHPWYSSRKPHPPTNPNKKSRKAKENVLLIRLTLICVLLKSFKTGTLLFWSISTLWLTLSVFCNLMQNLFDTHRWFNKFIQSKAAQAANVWNLNLQILRPTRSRDEVSLTPKACSILFMLCW